jgi:hypothetical protein
MIILWVTAGMALIAVGSYYLLQGKWLLGGVLTILGAVPVLLMVLGVIHFSF